MNSLPDDSDPVAELRWLDKALRAHGYFDGYEQFKEGDSLHWDNVLDDFWSHHAWSMIPARTSGRGDAMRAFDWFKEKGASLEDYLAFLERQSLRNTHRMIMTIDSRELDDEQRASHLASRAESERVMAAMNLEYPEEIETAASSDLRHILPSLN